MAYCTTTDVQTLLAPVGFSIGQTDPSTGTVDEPSTTTIGVIIIPDADQIIDGSLRGCYAVPITNSTDLQQIRLISMRLSASMCAEYLFGDRADPDVNTVLLTHRDRAMERLDLIRKGVIKLNTARLSFVDDGVHGLFTRGVTENYEAQVEIDKEF